MTSGIAADRVPAVILATRFVSVVPPPEIKTANRIGRSSGAESGRWAVMNPRQTIKVRFTRGDEVRREVVETKYTIAPQSQSRGILRRHSQKAKRVGWISLYGTDGDELIFTGARHSPISTMVVRCGRLL